MNSLLQLRLSIGLGQSELAEWLSISRSLLALAETERRNLPTEALIRSSRFKQALNELPEDVEGHEFPITFPREEKTLQLKAKGIDVEIDRMQLKINNLEEKLEIWQTALHLCRTLKTLDWIQADARLLDAIDRFHEKTWIAWCEQGPRELRRLRFYLNQKQEEKAFMEALANAYGAGEL